jgi:hypothetical protein
MMVIPNGFGPQGEIINWDDDGHPQILADSIH